MVGWTENETRTDKKMFASAQLFLQTSPYATVLCACIWVHFGFRYWNTFHSCNPICYSTPIIEDSAWKKNCQAAHNREMAHRFFTHTRTVRLEYLRPCFGFISNFFFLFFFGALTIRTIFSVWIPLSLIYALPALKFDHKQNTEITIFLRLNA